jgi:hypothetical protein
VITHLSDDVADYLSFSDTRKILPRKRSIQKTQPSSSMPAVSVKDMPDYDPDAGILGLAFTIPSWVSSIDRIHTTANITEVSVNARGRLEKALIALRCSADAMLLAIKEGE